MIDSFCRPTCIANEPLQVISPSQASSYKPSWAVFFFRLNNAKMSLRNIHWLHCWLSPTGEKIIYYGRLDSYNLLRFPEMADFRISEDASEIFCFPQPETSEETIRHLLLDQVLPRCLAHQERLMFMPVQFGSKRDYCFSSGIRAQANPLWQEIFIRLVNRLYQTIVCGLKRKRIRF